MRARLSATFAVKKPMNYPEILRTAASMAAGWLWATAGPALPFGVVCTAMVVADVVSARRLARRLRRIAPGQADGSLRFSSARLGRVVGTLARIYALLVLAAMVDSVVMDGGRVLLKFAAGAVCFWQAWSILENEAAANPRPWARILRRILVDKTARHLGIPLDELLRP